MTMGCPDPDSDGDGSPTSSTHARTRPRTSTASKTTTAVAARIVTVLQPVADAPPPKWSGGGFWETMHDEMAGYYEVRVDHARYRARAVPVDTSPRRLSVNPVWLTIGTQRSRRR